ncbi:hypothetical protein E2C01_096662 [Portunus trituberculatus]|uniref:Peptidase M13 N-terminal domain-containing protein n=1 Tax=Portunus trituberculatus TaxID=210409 RepID=A0A5B7K2L7_PORTR|nr:hypothetical protein [Portunus trituberculatus]
MFPNSKLDHRTDVLAVSREYFSDISEIISTTDANLLNNYLIFSFVSAYIPYLSSENTRVLNLFHKEFTGKVSGHSFRINIRQRSEITQGQHLLLYHYYYSDF